MPPQIYLIFNLKPPKKYIILALVELNSILGLADDVPRGSVADVCNLAAAYSGLRSLTLFGNSIGIPPTRKNPSSDGGFSLQTLDLSFNRISGDADLRLLPSSPSLLWRLDLIGN